MGRNYEANVSIENPQRGREKAIREDLNAFRGRSDCFEPGGIYDTEGGLAFVAQISLFGIDADDYARSLAECVWKANQSYCDVVVTMIYLDDQPRDDYEFGHDEYDAWMKISGTKDGRCLD